MKTKLITLIVSLSIIAALMTPTSAEARGIKSFCKRQPQRCEWVMPDYCGGRDGNLKRCGNR